MMDEHFTKGHSLLHTTAPKVKIVVAVFFVAVIALSSDYLVIAAGLAASIILLLLARLQSGPIIKRLLAANSFTLFIWLTIPLTYGGESLGTLGPLAISQEGCHLAALITLRTNAIVLSLIALLATSPIASIGHALEGLRVSPMFCFLLLFSYRYIFVIYQEYQKLTRAARMRSFVPSTSLHTYRTYGYLFGMTLVKSWNRASNIRKAMVLRGFNGRIIPLQHYTIVRKDIYFLVCSLVTIGCLFSLHFI
jgi:cobalt/nickel transport system permease protein